MSALGRCERFAMPLDRISDQSETLHAQRLGPDATVKLLEYRDTSARGVLAYAVETYERGKRTCVREYHVEVIGDAQTAIECAESEFDATVLEWSDHYVRLGGFTE